MMSTTTAISAPTTSFCITPPRTGTVTGNTGAAAQSVQAVPILRSVPTAQARMVWKAALTFACINLKKLAKMTWSAPKTLHIPRTFVHYLHDFISSLKTPPACSPAGGVCLQPEAHAEACAFIIWCVSPHMRRERTGFSHYSPLSGGRGCSGEKKSPKRPEMEEADRNGKK